MGDSTSNRTTLRNKFELEKFRSKVIKSQPKVDSSPSNGTQNQKATEIEEVIKHMKHLPSFLETRKPVTGRALSYGVMDWARLEKWQYQHHKSGLIKGNNKCSPSSSNSSSLFSTDSSSPRSSCSPARQKVHRVTLQSHFKSSPKKDFTQNVEKFQSFENLSSFHTPPSSCSKGKLKIQENFQDFSRNKNPERKTSNNSVTKPRSTSPLRRFSFSLSMGSKSESTISQKSTTDTNRAHSSPLRRLLDPIFTPKTHNLTDTCHEDSRTKAKTKLDFKNEIRVNDTSLSSSSSLRKQALFQTTVKNDRLLFRFAVENNKEEILAATVTNINSSEKGKSNCFLYTFFTVHEVKKKNTSWISHGNKSKDHGYVPNITAQMKVSNSHFDTREFVLFSVDPNVEKQEELEAIVVKFSKKGNEERFDATVILNGGNHGVPHKGEPLTPLIDRWRSGGVCDCGGWDVGCRLRTLTNRVRSSGSQPDEGHVTTRPFELFVQGEVENKKPIFSVSPLKEGIFSVEYNSSLSPLQAFSICISVVEPRKMSQNMQLITHAHKEVPLVYTPIPRIKKSTIGYVSA